MSVLTKILLLKNCTRWTQKRLDITFIYFVSWNNNHSLNRCHKVRVNKTTEPYAVVFYYDTFIVYHSIEYIMR